MRRNEVNSVVGTEPLKGVPGAIDLILNDRLRRPPAADGTLEGYHLAWLGWVPQCHETIEATHGHHRPCMRIMTRCHQFGQAGHEPL